MKKVIVAVASLALIGTTGCYTTGLSPREYGSSTYTQLIYGLNSDQPESAPQKECAKPIRLAVAQIGEVAPQTSFTESLQHNPALISEVIDIPLPGAEPTRYSYERRDEDVEAESVKFAKRTTAMRKLAKGLGADYVFLFGGNIDTDSIETAFTALDITIVGGLIIPSQIVKAEAKAAGALVDVDDGRVIFLVNTETKSDGLSPSAFVDAKEKRMQLKLRDQLLSDLSQKFLKRLEAQE